ncbi:Qat anti-phage system TatD family nuclease QatD [Salegentibacter sp. T436]|jgi:TatD DNase family protein|uniref:Qat anti-phage system TatD family nuclease QatD n=2 Tax=Salegentibacter TaxID=143222 RepID=UPI0018DDB420|nr:Qat anti-phage system TatD family nuclease QatD [Salegentibacter sp. T436]|tara:strand:- start:345 stop:1046 length:702 start_codon:yes stop_codon:yes gene_type:complete
MKDPEAVVQQIERNKCYTIAVTNSPSVFFYSKRLSLGTKYTRAALGFHPELVAERYQELPKYLDLLSQTRYIGEIGLDNHQKSAADFHKQLFVFKKIIAACRASGDKIITIHSRKAEKDVLQIIGANFPGKIILHWYSGPSNLIDNALSNGYYFSVNMRMLNSKNGRNIIQKLPLDRILLESDAPFTLSRNQRYHSILFQEMVAELATLKDFAKDEMFYYLNKNFKKLIEAPK